MKAPILLLVIAAFVMTPLNARAQATASASQLYSQAQRAYLRGDNESTKVLFQKLLSIDSRHLGARNYIRMIALEEQNTGAINPLESRLKALVIPSVSMKDASLSTAVEFLKQQADKLSDGALKPNMILSLPPGYADSTLVSVELSNIPFLEALKYVCRLSRTKYTIEKHGIVIEAESGAQPVSDVPPGTAPTIPGL